MPMTLAQAVQKLEPYELEDLSARLYKSGYSEFSIVNSYRDKIGRATVVVKVPNQQVLKTVVLER